MADHTTDKGTEAERAAGIINDIEAIIDSTTIFRHSAEGKAVRLLLGKLCTSPAAAVGAEGLPPLRRPLLSTRHGTPAYSVGQMLDYAREAIEAAALVSGDNPSIAAKAVLKEKQIDQIARSYFAEEYAQKHVANAIYDAFRLAALLASADDPSTARAGQEVEQPAALGDEQLQRDISELEAHNWDSGRDYTNGDVLDYLREIVNLRAQLARQSHGNSPESPDGSSNATQTSAAPEVSELLAALDAKDALMQQIRNAGMPPHSDYWHQSIDEANERIQKARSSLAREK